MNARPADETEDPRTLATELLRAAVPIEEVCPAAGRALLRRIALLEGAPSSDDAWEWLGRQGDAAAAEVRAFRASRRARPCAS